MMFIDEAWRVSVAVSICLVGSACVTSSTYDLNLNDFADKFQPVEIIPISYELKYGRVTVNFDYKNQDQLDVCFRLYEREFGTYSPYLWIEGEQLDRNPPLPYVAPEGEFKKVVVKPGGTIRLVVQYARNRLPDKLERRRFLVILHFERCSGGPIETHRSQIVKFSTVPRLPSPEPKYK